MKVNDMKQERTAAIRSMVALNDLATEEKRSLTEDEQTNYDELERSIPEFDKKIVSAENLENLQRSIAKDKPEEIIVNTENKENMSKLKFNIGTAMRELGSKAGLQGDNLKVHERGIEQGVEATNDYTMLVPAEAIRATSTVVTEPGLIITDVASDLDVIVPDPLYKTIGCRVLTGLTGNLSLPSMVHNEAAFVGEGVDVPAGNNTAAAKLTPLRVGITQPFSKELLASGNSTIMSNYISDMVAAIDTAIGKKMFVNIAAGAQAAVPGVLDATVVAKGQELVESEGKYVFTRAQYVKLKATPAGGATSDSTMVIKGGAIKGETFDGLEAIRTSLSTVALYGDYSHVTVGMWGGIEIIVDPYTGAKAGEINVTVNRLADVQVRNPLSFVSFTDAV